MTSSLQDLNDVRTFVRNRWFTGKLLDAYHMQLESDSSMHHRWLLNRLVLGSGVALGLDVCPAKDTNTLSFVVTQGLAIDWHGREIIVPQKTAPYPLDTTVLNQAIAQQLGQPQPKPQPAPKPARGATQSGKGGEGSAPANRVWVQLLIGYQEKYGDPVPADFGDECPGAMCVPGSIYEQFEVHFAPGKAEQPRCRCHVEGLLGANASDLHRHLANWVTHHRPKKELTPRPDPSLVLANIGIEVDENQEPCGRPEIDIEVREVVYYNDLLFQLILALAEQSDQQRGK